MKLFSERNKIKDVRTVVQIDDLDKKTRIKIWNLFCDSMEQVWKENSATTEFLKEFYCEIIEIPGDKIPVRDHRFPFNHRSNSDIPFNYHSNSDIYDQFRDKILNGDYNIVLDIIELFIRSFKIKKFNTKFDNLFKEKMVGYRIFNSGEIYPVANEEEYNEINEAMSKTYHIQKAIKYLYDKKKPDYENSIKESISAVEEVCRDITEMKKATLSDCLKCIEEHIQLHNAFKDALQKLYGWTSDEGGIRHSSTNYKDKMNLDHEIAKFMLVTCSAFVNYLKEKQIQINTSKNNI